MDYPIHSLLPIVHKINSLREKKTKLLSKLYEKQIIEIKIKKVGGSERIFVRTQLYNTLKDNVKLEKIDNEEMVTKLRVHSHTLTKDIMPYIKVCKRMKKQVKKYEKTYVQYLNLPESIPDLGRAAMYRIILDIIDRVYYMGFHESSVIRPRTEFYEDVAKRFELSMSTMNIEYNYTFFTISSDNKCTLISREDECKNKQLGMYLDTIEYKLIF